MGIQAAGQVAQHGAETSAAKGRNNAKMKNYWRQNKEFEVEANFENVKYLSDVQEQEGDQDRTYQAMVDQWSDTDFQLKSLFANEDFAIEEALIEMHEGSYAGTQTGATAARLAGKSAMEAGRKKARSIHNKMMATKDAERQKDRTWKAGKNDSHKLFMDVAFAPVHGFRPAAPELEAGPSKASLILGLADTGISGYKDFKKSGKKNIFRKKSGGSSSSSSTSGASSSRFRGKSKWTSW
tara:strand:- start:298 stop:1014 length:717 start_codon:yes stop_codon:yes gene_type:complete